MSRPQLTTEQVNQLPVTHEQVIPEDYLDSMGHMNVMWYTHLFSTASGGILRLLGITHQYLEEHQAGMFALETHNRYFSEVREDHRVTVHSRIVGRSAKRIHLMHFLQNHDKRDIAATLELVSTHIDMRVRRSSPFPQEIAQAIDELADEHARLPWELPLCGVMRP